MNLLNKFARPAVVVFCLFASACSAETGHEPAGGPAVSLQDFGTSVEKQAGLVLVDFWAPWCPPCRKMVPTFEKVEPSYQDRVKFMKVDVDQSGDVARKYEVSGIPCLILFKDGQEADRKVGLQSEAALRAWLDQHAPAAPAKP